MSERESPAKGPTTPFLLSASVSTSVQVVSVAQVFLQPQRAAVFTIPPRGCFVFDFLFRGLPESRLGAMCPRSILHSTTVLGTHKTYSLAICNISNLPSVFCMCQFSVNQEKCVCLPVCLPLFRSFSYCLREAFRGPLFLNDCGDLSSTSCSQRSTKSTILP